jgi:uncharacterized protein (TIGR00296 family)
MEIGEREGKILVDIAKAAIAAYLKEGVKIEIPEDIPAILKQKFGVFISLKKKEGNDRDKSISSIGYLLPFKTAAEAIVDSAMAAAIRARLYGIESIDDVNVEVTIINSIEPLQVHQRVTLPEYIKLGEDGILIERGFQRALYLPQIAIERGWDSLDFLSECCMKAGLMPDAWLDEDTKLYKFKVKVFK